MKQVKALVISGYGLNCEEETAYGFELVGAKADIVHINDLIEGRKKLADYQIMVFPGGFSYGDDTGSGYAFGNRVKNHLWEDVLKFVEKDKLVLGICNGFQILVNLGLMPEVALRWNKKPRYIDAWVDLKVENTTSWLKGLIEFSLPVANGEGRFYADKKILKELKQKKLVALRYVNQTNPNGSLDDIAGIIDETGRVFGLMPHPERGMLFHQLPDWTYLKEKFRREKKKLPKFAAGLQIFNNGVEYFK